MNLKNWSNYCSSWNCGINSGIWLSTRVCFPCMLEFDCQNRHLRLQRFRSTFQLYEIDTSSQTLRKLDFFLQWFEVLKTFSQSFPRFWVITPRGLHQRIYFLRFHFSEYLLIFFRRISFWSHLSHSASDRTPHTSLRLLRRYWADLLSESFETRVLRSKHPRYLCYYFLSEFNELEALMLVNTGCPVSLKCPTISVAMESNFRSGLLVCVPYHFSSSPGPKNDQCPREKLFA